MIMTNLNELIEQGHIATALAFTKAKSIHSNIETMFQYFLVSDVIAEDFVFNQNGLDILLNMMFNPTKASFEEISDSVKNNNEEEKIVTSSNEAVEQPPAPTEPSDDFIDSENELFEFIK